MWGGCRFPAKIRREYLVQKVEENRMFERFGNSIENSFVFVGEIV